MSPPFNDPPSGMPIFPPANDGGHGSSAAEPEPTVLDDERAVEYLVPHEPPGPGGHPVFPDSWGDGVVAYNPAHLTEVASMKDRALDFGYVAPTPWDGTWKVVARQAGNPNQWPVVLDRGLTEVDAAALVARTAREFWPR